MDESLLTLMEMDSVDELAENVDETEQAYTAAGAVTTEPQGHGAVESREFRLFKARFGKNRSGATARFREVTQIVCVERMISPSTGHGPASVQKFVVSVGVDNRLYIFQDTSEDAVGSNAYTPPL